MIEPKLQEAGIALGRDRLFDVLREARLLVPQRRAYHKTTNSHHRFRRHPYLLKPGEGCVTPTGSEQVWVADITYLPTDGNLVYLSLVTDAWSRKIVGWSVNETLQTEHTARALEMALKARKTRERPIHHSDRGIQYCSDWPVRYTDTATVSMTPPALGAGRSVGHGAAARQTFPVYS